MQCPVCETSKLQMAERQGVEIDYCPDCRGIWLDRGELDKIIERSAEDVQGTGDGPKPEGSYKDYKKKKKKKGILDELLDF
jgi:Zn-finger nucleic acid-binding protein